MGYNFLSRWSPTIYISNQLDNISCKQNNTKSPLDLPDTLEHLYQSLGYQPYKHFNAMCALPSPP